jgi:hypothetical protein
VTKVAAGNANAYINLPAILARRHDSVTHIDWTAVATDFNGLFSGTQLLYVGYYGVAGQQFNMSAVAYMGNPPPPTPLPARTLKGLQAAIGTKLQTIAGLRVYDFPSDRVETPAAVLSLPETPYDLTLDGRNDQWIFPLWILIARADDKASYVEMVDYLEAEGPKSIRAILEADRTLGGACDSLIVQSARPLFATVAGTDFLAVEFTLEVIT